MSKEVIELTENTAVIKSNTLKDIGSDLDIEIKLPEDILLESFALNGTVTDCVHVQNNGTSGYAVKIVIGNISKENQQILAAYVDFLERQKKLDTIKIDTDALEKAFGKIGECLIRAITWSEMLNKESVKKKIHRN